MSDLAEDVLAPGLEEEFGLYEAVSDRVKPRTKS